jgi:hypothetical protein
VHVRHHVVTPLLFLDGGRLELLCVQMLRRHNPVAMMNLL